MATAQAMSGADAAWLRMDRPTNHMIINSVMTFEQPLPFDRLRAILDERMVARFPRFRQRVASAGPLGGPPRWVDDPSFDLDLHVHRIALGGRRDAEALQELVSHLMSRGLDRDRPLWEVYLIEHYGKGSALLTRMHHCIADGIALARVLMLLTDAPSPEDEAAFAEPTPHRGSRLPGAGLVGAAATLAHEGLETALHPGRVVGLGRELRDDTLAALQLLLSPIDPPSALKGGHGVAQRVAWTPALPLDEVKAIARATDTTVNDVLMSSLSGALARFLDDHGDLPRDLHAMVPFNVRPLDRPLPPELGNDFGLIMLGLALAARSPLDRLGEVSRRMRAIKDSRQPVVSYAILATIGHAPQRVEEWLIDFFSSKSTAVVTNVPGPRQPVMLAGVPISDIMVWAPCAGSISASVSIFSYCGAVTVGFMTHASHVPEPARLSDALLAEFHSLREAVSGASA